MTKKVLFTANLESFFTKFLIPQLKRFKENGYEVHIACKLEGLEVPFCDKKYDVNFARSLNLKQNIESYKQMIKIFKSEHYDIVSCHTPFGGAITRLAFKNAKVKNTKMVYMAHGFHFYKGAPLKNWLLFYTAEKYLSKYTDILITINKEDYEIAKKNFKCKVKLIKGVGLDVKKFDFKMDEKEKNKFRKSLGFSNDDFLITYAAELLPRKRQIWLINTLKEIIKDKKNIHLLLPGRDSMKGECQKYVKSLNLENNIHFLGFRRDIPQILSISDLAVSSSLQEGLPVNIMEAMYVGLPIVATNCRGNRDLVENNVNGYIVEMNDSETFANKVLKIYNHDVDINKIALKSKKKIKAFLLNNVINEIMKYYN